MDSMLRELVESVVKATHPLCPTNIACANLKQYLAVKRRVVPTDLWSVPGSVKQRCEDHQIQ